MAASYAAAWARLRLVQGKSATSRWEFGGSDGETRLTIGSNPSCQWVVEDPSVEPFHLVARWDGSALSLAGAQAGLDITLDGQPVGMALVRVGARGRLEFGRCAMVVESSASSLRRRPSRGSGPPAAGSEPPAAHSSRPPARTVTGVRSLTDSTPPSRVRESGPAPSGRAPVPERSPTSVGMPPSPRDAPGSQPPARHSSAPPPGWRSRPPPGSTRYGLREQDADSPRADVVSPAGLRRSSVPPGASSQGDRQGVLGPPSARARPARPDRTPTDTQLAPDPTPRPHAASRASGPSGQAPGAVPPGAAPHFVAGAASDWVAQGPTSGGTADGVPPVPRASDRPVQPSSGGGVFQPKTRWAIVLGLAAVVGLGALAYAALGL